MNRLAAFTIAAVIGAAVAAQEPAPVYIPYPEAEPILAALRQDLVPAELAALAPAAREAAWPAWVERRDREIRARVALGDEDSIINYLLYGTTFTKAPRATEQDLGRLVSQPSEALRDLRGRIDDFMAAVALPGDDERLRFARDVLDRHGIDPATEAGMAEARRFLQERTVAKESAGASRSRTLLELAADVQLTDKLTLFRERGLSSDTSLLVDLGIEQALEAIAAAGLLRPRSVRRAAIIGPGLDFVDKLDGYDFYPEQTIQPFALMDALLRTRLADAALEITAFDISPRVVRHVERARALAREGKAYPIVLARNLDRPWTMQAVDYWERFGDRIGDEARAPMPPAAAGRVAVRGVAVGPGIVLRTTARDLNVVLQRSAPGDEGERFDLVVATNILLYYDVFEQSLAMANLAAMLRPGGLLLTNNRVFELPALPFSGVGYTDAVYMTLPGIGEAGDRIIWYQRQ